MTAPAPVKVSIFKLAPEVFAPALAMWLHHGVQPKDEFLWQVLRGDLGGVVGLSGRDSWGLVHALQMWLWNFAPPACYGSAEAVASWHGTHGFLTRRVPVAEARVQ